MLKINADLNQPINILMIIRKITKPHKKPGYMPLILHAGDNIQPGIETKEEKWKGWIWAENETNSGWVPVQILDIAEDKSTAKVLENYSSQELDVDRGESVEVIRSLYGWSWVRNTASKSEGWIPDDIMQPGKTKISIRRLILDDADSLSSYLQALSPQSKQRFGPHPFDFDAVSAVLKDTDNHFAYGAFCTETNELTAYSLIRRGYISFDKERFANYGIALCETTDCTYAPSVADSWQNKKIGSQVFSFILNDLPLHFERIIFWGGVQADNAIAVAFYQHKNFRLLGEFEHNGNNYDMILNLKD